MWKTRSSWPARSAGAFGSPWRARYAGDAQHTSCVVPTLRAADASLIVASDLLRLKQLESPALSPDGRQRFRQEGETSADIDSEIHERLALIISNEAKLCLDEGVAASASDIDLAMVLGTGYPPFRGGPITFARDTGIIDY